MSHLFRHFREEIIASLKRLQEKGLLNGDPDFSRVTAEPPREASHGDIASNAAMVLAKGAGMPPVKLAGLLADEMGSHPFVRDIRIAGPGFVNFSLSPEFWQKTLGDILKAGTLWGASDIGKGIHVNLEYVSANPTGPIHIGHCRGAIVGDILGNILEKAGHEVTREYYINDAGGQVNELARSVWKRYLQALGMPVEDIGSYGGDYLIPLGKELAEKYGDAWVKKDESEWLSLFRGFSVERMIEKIRDDLEVLNIHHDVFTSEKALVDAGKVEEAYDFLLDRGLIYHGVLTPPKGMAVEDYEPREQDLFRSTAFGDDVDRPLKKSDGSWTYFAPDIAYHLDKYQRGASRMILVLGADHGGYVSRLSAAVRALTDGNGSVTVKLCQMVKFMDGDTVLKMSKRAGVFVTVHEAISRVGRDAIRFMMVWRKNDAPLDFDFKKVVEQTRDNPVFYVQYATARCHSIRRHALEVFPDFDLGRERLANHARLDLIQDTADLEMIRLLANWPRVVEAAAETEEPHRIAYYIYEVASAFHSLWNKGKENTALRFVVPDDEIATFSRLALVEGIATVLESGLQILGVEVKQEMRDE